MVTAEDRDEIQSLFGKHPEWLIVPSEGEAFSVSCSEIEVSHQKRQLHFGFLDGKGYHTWRINSFSSSDEEIHLDLAGAFGRNRTQIKLVPRISAAALAAEIEIARLKRANAIAELVKEGLNVTRIRRVELAKENGRLAHIF